MAKNKGRKTRSKRVSEASSNSKNTPFVVISSATKYAMIAVVLIALGAFLGLSAFGSAGVIGDFLYYYLDRLFGVGYFLGPLALLTLAVSFLRAKEPNLVASHLIGGILFFLSSLGLVGIGSPEAGGLVGGAIAGGLKSLIEIYASVIFLGALVVVSVLMIFDTKLTLDFKLFGWAPFDRPEELEQEDEKGLYGTVPAPEKEVEPIVKMPEQIVPAVAIAKKTASDAFDNFTASGHKRSIDSAYNPPPLSLLSGDQGKPNVGDLKANSNIIKRTLSNFGINVEMDEVSIGPTVTRYALKPAEGVKLARLVGLHNDLALALAAHPIRIEAPIPGKSLVGIEIPNTQKAIVGLASLVGAKDFQDSPHPLLVSLGRGISGVPHFSNIAKAPHMLIAGATGSGKSVVIHTFISSLLYRNSPDRLRLIMIDPKRVELTLYNGIPHLLSPVITDPKKAIASLRWAAKEMDRRYNLLEKNAVRDIQSYHKNVVQTGKKDADGEAPEQMPYIVIVIDELADIMTTYPRELEAAVVRLAQMSRAVGIHLVLSTQRPSVEVITGLIKANIPSRIALQVASQIDSRTILDMAGAEKLLGAGDMLYISADMSKPIRLQSAFISEQEVKAVTDYLKKNNQDYIPEDISQELTANNGATGSSGLFGTALDAGEDDDDPLMDEATRAVTEAGKASASYLQRKLKVGYARAARLLDLLEARGIIGPGDGAKPREVYTKNQDGDLPPLAEEENDPFN